MKIVYSGSEEKHRIEMLQLVCSIKTCKNSDRRTGVLKSSQHLGWFGLRMVVLYVAFLGASERHAGYFGWLQAGY